MKRMKKIPLLLGALVICIFSLVYTVKQIAPSDQAKGISILSKLNIGYIMDLRKDGFTDEEKLKIKQHIQSKLSKEKINELAHLYQQYSYLLK